MSPELEHLLTLARAGHHGHASGVERQARKLVRSVLQNAIGLDGQATDGVTQLIHLVQAQPMFLRDYVKTYTGIK
jgi:hypothetical protein